MSTLSSGQNGNKLSNLPQSKDRQYFAELIVALEERLDINAIEYDGVKLWPIIRWMLAKEIKGTATKEGITDSLDSVRAERFTGGREERKQLVAKRRDAERQKYKDPHLQIEAQLVRLREIGRCDYLVFSKIEKYYQSIGDKFYAPIVDPVYEDLCLRGKTRMIALEPLDLFCVHEPVRLSIDPYMRITSQFQNTPMPPELVDWEERINQELAILSPDFRLDMSMLFNRLNRYRRRIIFFSDILEILKPKAIFFSSFVGWTPLVLAAKQKGIVSVDIQHGGQSPYHYHTTHWTKVPREGYELLPDVFWVWGSGIKKYIDPWLPGGSIRHKPVAGGHRYAAKWSKGSESIGETKDYQELEPLLDKAEKVILVTLGYSVDDILPECVVELIERTPSWIWLIRLHPINRGQAAIDEVRAKTINRGLSNVEYVRSTRLPLFALLSRSSFHITPFSTTCREAQAFGVKSAIVDPIGGTYFKDEIAQGLYGYAETADDILKLIENRGMGEAIGSPEFIQTEDSLVEDVLDEVARIAAVIEPANILMSNQGDMSKHQTKEPDQHNKNAPKRVRSLISYLRRLNS